MDEGTKQNILIFYKTAGPLHSWFFQNSSELFEEGEKEVFPFVQTLK